MRRAQEQGNRRGRLGFMGGWRRTAASLVGLVALACLVLAGRDAGGAQAVGVLRITVTIDAGEGAATPVPRHALLVSDNPASRAPWRVVTARDGTARVTLAPGQLHGRVRGTARVPGQGLRVAPDRRRGRPGATRRSHLTAANAEVATASTEPTPAGTPPQDRPVGTADPVAGQRRRRSGRRRTHASGTVIASTGLIATAQRVVGSATTRGGAVLADREGVGTRARVGRRAGSRDPVGRPGGTRSARSHCRSDATAQTRPVLERGQRVSAIGTHARSDSPPRRPAPCDASLAACSRRSSTSTSAVRAGPCSRQTAPWSG